MSKAEEKAEKVYPAWRNGIGDEFNSNSAYYGFIKGYRQAEKDIQPMFELSNAILEVVKNFKPFMDGQQGWVTLLLMALGRATSITLASLDYIGATTTPAMEIYTKMILPMSELAESHRDTMKEATRKAKDTEEDKDVN